MDQWGNITAGTELIRRVEGGEAHGLAAPLVTTASGAKLGKTEGGAVWLDPEITSPYKLYQFCINVDDRDVESYLKIFTFLSSDDIANALAAHGKDRGARIPQQALARDFTARVHGAATAERVRHASRIMFGEADPREADAATWDMLAREVPHAPLQNGLEIPVSAVDLVAGSSLAKSKGEARRLLSQGGVSLNGRPLAADATVGAADVLPGGYLWLRRGKKSDFIFTTAP